MNHTGTAAVVVILAFTLPDSARAQAVAVLPAQGFSDARQPQAAVDADGALHVVFGERDSIHLTTSRDGGKTFSVPVQVGEAGKLALGHRRGPRIAVTKGLLVVTAICGENGSGKDGDVLAWRSSDRGATWLGPVRINSVPGAAREGLHHLTASTDGRFYCVWNDLRTTRKMPVFGALSLDGASWNHQQAVYTSPDGSICPCCQSLAAFDPQGRLHVMWRNSLAGARDMYLSTSSDGGKTFAAAQKLGLGEWQFDT
jgi:hypothetical protein